MKSIKQEKCDKKKEKPFPKLMIHSSFGSIYLMTSPTKGTIVNLGNHSSSSLGDQCINITPKYCSDYNDAICLSNEEP
jgi:hypothetical protein